MRLNRGQNTSHNSLKICKSSRRHRQKFVTKFPLENAVKAIASAYFKYCKGLYRQKVKKKS